MRVQNRFDSKKIGELVCDGALKYVQNFAVEIDGERVAEYKSLDKVALDWKDYKPQEPCIENKEVRKAVRVWAEACGVKEVVFYLFGRESDFWNNDDKNVGISFNFPLRLEDGRVYTIPELCGELES